MLKLYLHAVVQLHDQQRMPTEIKEIFIHTYGIQLQGILP